MRRIGLIGCSKKKKSYSTKAQELYQGALFQKSLTLCKLKRFDAIYILSAKHGFFLIKFLLLMNTPYLICLFLSERIGLKRFVNNYWKRGNRIVNYGFIAASCIISILSERNLWKVLE
jgi:hypothetical protein